MLALTLTHCVTSGQARSLPEPRLPRLLTGINDLSLKSPAAPRSRAPPWMGGTGRVAAPVGRRCQLRQLGRGQATRSLWVG